MADTVLVHPNREKAESKATKAAVTLLLITSSALILIILVGGWKKQAGLQIVALAYVFVYALMAYLVRKWNRGVLPVAAGMAILWTIVSLVAAPAWFDNDKHGFADPGLLEASILGLLTVILVPVQILLIAFSLRGLQQNWSTEIEMPREEAERYRRGDHEGEPQTA